MRAARITLTVLTIVLMIGIDAIMLYSIFPEWYTEGLRALVALLP